MIDKKHVDIEAFNNVVADCEAYLFASRDIQLQKDAAVRAEKEKMRIESLKAKAASEGNEDLANLFLGCLCILDSIHAQLNMWISLKENNANQAWDRLVDAQMAVTGAVKAHSSFGHVAKYLEKLEALERLLFPKQVFVSCGFIVGFQECSICKQEYGECSHIVGRPYQGKFCCIVARELTADHVAVVKNPADKRCRIMQAPVEGGQKDWMSWVVTPDEDGKTSDPDVVEARFV